MITASQVGVEGEGAEVAQGGDLAPHVVRRWPRASGGGRPCAARSSRRADDAEVEQGGAPVGQHEEVAAVQVAVEDAVDHGALHEARSWPVRTTSSVSMPAPLHAGDVVELEARQPLHDEDPPRHEARVRAGHDVAPLASSDEHLRRCRACCRPRAGSRAPRRSSPRTARPAPAGWPARRPGCARRGEAPARTSPAGPCGRGRRPAAAAPSRRPARRCASGRRGPGRSTAAASGVRSNHSKVASSVVPRSASTTCRTTANVSSRTWSRQSLNSSTSSDGKRPSPEEMIWPSLM